MPEHEYIAPDTGDFLVAERPHIKRPDSLTSINSLSSGYGSSKGYDRQMSVTSLSSLIADDDLVSQSRVTPDSEDDHGLQMVVSSKTKSGYKIKDNGTLQRRSSFENNIIITKFASKEISKTWISEDKIEEVKKQPARKYNVEKFEDAPTDVQVFIRLSLQVLKTVGRIRETVMPAGGAEANKIGYAPLYSTDDFGGFHYRNIFRRWQDCFCNPINSAATNMVSLMERKFESNYSSKYTLTGDSQWFINLGSYNYLGFGGVGTCAEHAESAICEYGIGGASVRQELGTQRLHTRLESLVAEFLGVEAAVTFGMGFATNSTNLPSLVGPDCLVLSDRMNHASIILGMRLSGATIRVFNHNDMIHLEQQLVRAITKDTKQWRKILIVVEGVYSMEGSLVLLPDVIRLKKQYGAYLYLDEAHSIGALGASGRGVVEYYGCDPADVDVMMGTFTKSFGAAGGYIAGSQRLIDHLKACSHSAAYATAMPPAVCQQVLSSMLIIMGRDGSSIGTNKINTLARNSHFFRQRIRQLGFIVYGNDDSPVVPLMSFFVSKTAALYRRLKDFGIATAVIAYPATPLDAARARFCLSASHTKEQLEYVIEVLDKLGDELEIKYSREQPRTDVIQY